MLVEHSVTCPVLIGRRGPRDAGLAVLEAARASRGSLLLISGEAGIGKSRMVRTLLEHAREHGHVTLSGACFEADRAHPYAPVLDMVRVLASIESSARAAELFAPAAADLVSLFPELQSIFATTAARRSLGPEEDRRRLFQTFGESVQLSARRQPLLLVIEDVHWSDDATLDLVLHLARHITTQPITLLLTFRSDEVGPRLRRLLVDLDRARSAAELSLRPLDVDDVRAMLEAIFCPQVVLDDSFVKALHALTEGNPFFVEEMLKALLVAGDLARSDGVWRARPLEQLRVPRTATEAVARRLAQLSDAARRVASVAAVAGRRFDFSLLQALTQHDELTLLALVKELIEAQLVVEESADRFAFRHALTRESMRTQLLARERVALHSAIATALEGQDGDHDDDLAYHTFESGAWEKARRYSRRAADHAWTLCAPRESLQHLDRAVLATERAGVIVEPALLVARGRAHETLGAFSQAHDDFTAAFDAARTQGDRRAAWRALHSLGMLWAARDYEKAGLYRRDALALARAIEDPTLVAHSLNRVGNWYVNREDPQSGIPHHDEALAIFERAGDHRGVVETVDLLAMAHHIAGNEATAGVLYERAIDLFTQLEDRRGLANALAVLAVCGPSHHAAAGAVFVSRHAAALLVQERPVKLASEIGWRAGEAFSRCLIGDCLAWRGEYGRALHLARESLAIAEEIEHLEWQCAARRVLGMIALDLCALPEALAQHERAHAIARRLVSATWTRWTGAPLAITLARAGQHQRATVVLDEIDALVPHAPKAGAGVVRDTLGERYLTNARAEVALAAGQPDRVLTLLHDHDAVGAPRLSLLRAEAFATLQRWDECEQMLQMARADADVQGAVPFGWRIDALLGTLHLAGRRRLVARRLFDTARAAAEELVSTLAEPALMIAFRAAVDQKAPPPPPHTTGQRAKAAHGGLTGREREVAAQVALGKPNRAIARFLGIGERTVEGYVAGALTKLGFSSRAQLAVWAAERGLTIRGGTARSTR